MVSARRRTVFSFVFLAMLAPFVASVITPQIYILASDEIESEDVYVATESARIDGRIEGDLFIAAGAIDIAGTVTGDVFALSHGRLNIAGSVEGSVRGLAREIVVAGSVGGDVAAVAGSVQVTGTAARDLLVIGGSVGATGVVGRDVLGRFLDGSIDGVVGGDVDVSVRSLRVGPRADVGGDLLYRADGDATVSGGSKVAGQFRRLPSRAVFVVRVWLIGATILTFLAFVVSGMVLLTVFRSTMARATGLVRTEPWRSVWVGFLVVLGLPLLSTIFVFTVVGAPVGVLLLVLWALGLVFGPVPAVAAGGDLLLRSRGGLFGAFVVGAVLWRLGIWLIPLVGVLLYSAALASGAGAIVMAAWRQRKAGVAGGVPLLPPAMSDLDDSPADDWLPPLAPNPASVGTTPEDTDEPTPE